VVNVFPTTRHRALFAQTPEQAPLPIFHKEISCAFHLFCFPHPCFFSLRLLIQEEQARHIAGTYDLANGWRLKVRPGTRTIDTKIDKQQPMRLLAVAPYKFVSGDGRVTMEFNRGEFGDDMLMTYAPDPRFADMVVISSAVAQR